MTTAVTAAALDAPSRRPDRPPVRRLLPWLGLLAAALLGALLVAALASPPERSLDLASASPSGSKALSRVLAHYGVRVRATASVADAASTGTRTVVVTAPDEYSDAQLRRLRHGAVRLVLVRPAVRAVRAVLPGSEPATSGPDERPGCSSPGPRAAGDLSLPDDAVAYTGDTGVTRCYGGLVLLAPRLVLVGSADLLTNDRLGRAGDAALAINLLTADRTVAAVAWLQPGDDAAGNGARSIRDLFPSSWFRALWWLLVVAVLLALWRARRLGAPVTEPLPVVVRSAESVEGHGRLYLRAGARDRAAAALRDATLRRICVRLALPTGATAAQVATVAGPLDGRPPADVLAVLHGTVPADDPALQRLARDLHDLENAASRSAATGGEHGR